MWEGVVKSTRSYIARSPETVVESELIDDLVFSYLHWKEMCIKAHLAYDRWCACTTLVRPEAYAAFGAALDREESAADIYRRMVDRIERVP
jgi:hypothetical protein